MTIGYLICFVLAVGLLIGYMVLVKNKEFWLGMLYICVTIVNLGYFLLSVSKTVEIAILSNDLVYLGSVFLSMCMMLTIVCLCGFEIKRGYVISCLVVGIIMFAVVATSFFLPWYYKSVDVEVIDGATRLVKEYGPLHNLYLVYLVSYFAAMIITIVYSVKRKKVGSTKFAGFIAGVVCGNIIVWLFEKFVRWEFGSFLLHTFNLQNNGEAGRKTVSLTKCIGGF